MAENKNSHVPDEIIHDPYKLFLYKKAIRRGKEKERTLRINVIGNYAQGKTSLVKRLAGESCKGVTSTNGIEIKRYRCKTSEDGENMLTTTDDETREYVNRVATVARSIKTTNENRHDENQIYAKSKENVLPYEYTVEEHSSVDETGTQHSTDVPNRQTYPKRPKLDNPLPSQKQETKTRKQKVFSDEEFSKFAEMVEEPYDKRPILLDIWDFGGQYVFYATHTLFHSSRALYLLVFDLSSPLTEIIRDEEFPGETGDKNMEFFARFWIESIHAYVGQDPQVILVGTHKDKLQDNKQKIRDYFERVRCLFDDTELIHHIQREDFAVDNHDHTDPGITELFQFILKKHQQLVHPVEVPIRWIQMEKALKDLQPKKIITVQEVMQIDKENEYPLEEEQAKLFLQYHHERGSLFYFDEDDISDYIVLDPMYLIDAFKCIVTSEQFCRSDPDIRSLWQSLTKQGKLTNTLIDKVWSNESANFMKHRTVLIGFLTKYNIISRVIEYDVDTGYCHKKDWYIVPSLLKEHSLGKEMTEFLEKKTETKIRYVIRFGKSAIVHMVYHKVIAAALGIWSVVTFRGKMLLFENMCVFSLIKTHAGIIELRQPVGTIELKVINLRPFPVEWDPIDQFKRFVEHVVVAEFRKLNSPDGENLEPFTRAYRCNDKSHGREGNGSRELSLLKDDEDVTCPDNCTHDDSYYTQAKTEWFPSDMSDGAYPKMQLTKKNLSYLSQRAIGKNWSLLGIELNLRQTETDQIEMDNHTTAMKIYTVLLKWQARAEDRATLDVLVDAIRKCPDVTIEWNEFRNLRDKFYRDISSKETALVQPLSNKTVQIHETLILECQISNSDVPAIWLKDNKAIDSDTDQVKISKKGGTHQLVVENVTVNDCATYRCDFGNMITECVVKVEDPDEALEFIMEPSDIEVGDTPCSATFLCTLNKKADVEWYFKNQGIRCTDKYIISSEGNVQKLLIKDVSESDEGTYSIVAGGKQSKAVLFVEETEEEKRLFAQHLLKQKGMLGVPAMQSQGQRSEELGVSSYRMDRKPRGWCVILNNDTFYVDGGNTGGHGEPLPHRSGTESDAESLQDLFRKLGFIVRRHDNLPDDEMMNVLIDAAHVDHTNFDCFVCCILTHGVPGHLYGSNGAKVSIKDLTSVFKKRPCATLFGKPKLFFVLGTEIRLDDSKPKADLEDVVHLMSDIPMEPDFLVSYATCPGYVLYIKKLCEQLNKYAESMDLFIMLAQLNGEIAAIRDSTDRSLFKLMTKTTSTLTKIIYFR